MAHFQPIKSVQYRRAKHEFIVKNKYGDMRLSIDGVIHDNKKNDVFFAFKKYSMGVECSAHIQTLGNVSPTSQPISATITASKTPKKV